jgi:alpha-maltose-1-phosphate synthase
MRVVLSTIGKFHTFDLARELYARRTLTAIFTGYPRYKLQSEALPADLIVTFPWLHAPYMGLPYRRFLGNRILRAWEYADKVALDRYVSLRLPECDVFVGLSGSASKSGRKAHASGAKYVCDRGSSHIRAQDDLLREEHHRWGVQYAGIDPRVIELEEAEYAESDCITVPSSFNVRSFVEYGVPEAKVKRIPYGVNLEKFYPTGAPARDQFDILFAGNMSLRKGVQYLLQAFRSVQHPKKSLTFAGDAPAQFIDIMKRSSLWPEHVRVLGHVPQQRLRDLMSRSHVLVLPSIEEGLAMVQAQAMACACPVIGTAHTGAEDLFEDGVEGFITPVRQPDALADRLQLIADDIEVRSRLSEAAIARVKQLNGWRTYGDQVSATYESLMRGLPQGNP